MGRISEAMRPNEGLVVRAAPGSYQGTSVRSAKSQTAAVGFDVDLQVLSVQNPPGQKPHGQRIHQLGLNSPFERASPVDRIKAALGQIFDRFRAEVQAELASGQARSQNVHLNLNYSFDFFFTQGVEDDDIIHPVEEFGAEMSPQSFHDSGSHGLLIPSGRFVDNILRTDVGGHDHHRIFKIHGAALAVCQAAVVQKLQQSVENFRVGLFHLVK